MPRFEYDAIVIGGGAAGLTASGIAANLGAKTMMIEAHRLGGDCTWTGCVPSKSLLSVGKLISSIKTSGKFEFTDGEPTIDFAKIMNHVHTVRQHVYHDADRPELYENMGIEVVTGMASFSDAHTLHIQLPNQTERTVSSRYFFIATGAKAFVPPIPGLNDVPYLTHESLFELSELPHHLLIIGGGPIGLEMAQAFRNLGADVTVLEMAEQLLVQEDAELVSYLSEALKKEGITFETGISIEKVTPLKNGIQVHYNDNGEAQTAKGSHLLVATGRRANFDHLNLEAAGVAFTHKGIQVNRQCRTNISHIYAMGDVNGCYQLTHMAEHMSKVAVTRALLKVPMKIDELHVPRVIYTSPELAYVGATEKQLKERGKKYEVYRFPYSKIDRAITESEPRGMIKILASKLSGKIYGAGVVGAHAGELISEYAVAMRNGISLRKLADTIHPYPSWTHGARRAADQWYIKNQSEQTVKWIKRLFGYRGSIPDYSDPNRIV